MRTFLRAIVFAVALGSLTPDVALCQLPEDDFDERFDDDDAPPPPVKVTKKPARSSWRNSPVTWTLGAAALAVAIPLGIWKTVGHMRTWSEEQKRPRAAWEGEPPPK